MKIKEAIQESMVTHLLRLCKAELELDRLPEIIFISDVPSLAYKDTHSFGEFDGAAIRVITTNRHPVDVLRTLSHELVHWKQQENGNELDGSDGSDIENQANSIAGIIMRKFSHKYPDYFINSLP